MYKNKSVKGLEKVNIKIGNESCIPCNVGKATRTSMKKNYVYKRVTKSVLDKVLMDLWGSAPVNSLGGSKYFLSIIDDFSRKIDVFTRKSEVFSIFKEYLSRVQRELGRKLKSVRTDDGMEFCHKDFETFLRDLGIRIERTSFYTPGLNGINLLLYKLCRKFEGYFLRIGWPFRLNILMDEHRKGILLIYQVSS
ncbi:Retrovirus-related Pol polyprotein from transposon TNT 1-94 [Araneus ventricosus]|uniref:Retrovirus-related Pol polyprotein from transposon TNT 1-94 n=1 Tax=Araneus ventricosus TaxID=182803 RepID=A0A4Y2BBT0_ARAVE|nr:Retrovirus-related Pol polyprotein from transposon TNT 1-94 [Araneus ventricosus]